MVLKAIDRLKNSSSSGPDGIPAMILKHCVVSIASVLTKIFTESLRTGTFLAIWRVSWLTPIQKKRCKNEANNFRRITSLSVCAKVFELFIYGPLLASACNYISINQYGFVPKRSITTNLVQFMSTCHRSIDNGFQVDTIDTDIKAACDCVSHSILLAKLDILGLPPSLVLWFKYYLADRCYAVRLGQHLSRHNRASSGVPQGSNLGPLLSLFYINDVPSVLADSNCLLYADDAKIYREIRDPEDHQRLQASLIEFNSWCKRNALTISIKKCAAITFNRSRTPAHYTYMLNGLSLARVFCAKDLGDYLDARLSFDAQLDDVDDCPWLSRMLGLIANMTRALRDPLCIKALYCALVRPLLEYPCIVWWPSSTQAIARLQSIQRRARRPYSAYLVGIHHPVP